MRHLDEGTVHAFVDGALDAARVREVEAHLAECAACRGAVGEARGLVAASSRILAALDAVPGGVVPPGDGMRGGGRSGGGGGGGFRARGFTASRWGWAAAAVMVLAAGVVLTSRTRGGRRAPERLAVETESRAGAAAGMPTSAPVSAPSAALKPVPAGRPQRAAVAAAPPPATSDEAPGAQRGVMEVDSVAMAPAAIARMADSVAVADSIARARSGSSPRRLGVDSVREAGGVVVRTRYAWTKGVVLTLVATPPGVHAPNGEAADAMPLRTAPTVNEAAAPVHVIEWTGADGTRYRLSGATSVAELQRARAALR